MLGFMFVIQQNRGCWLRLHNKSMVILNVFFFSKINGLDELSSKWKAVVEQRSWILKVEFWLVKGILLCMVLILAHLLIPMIWSHKEPIISY